MKATGRERNRLRGPSDFWQCAFLDLVTPLPVKVWNAPVLPGWRERRKWEDENARPAALARVGGGNTVSCLDVRALRTAHCHRVNGRRGSAPSKAAFVNAAVSSRTRRYELRPGGFAKQLHSLLIQPGLSLGSRVTARETLLAVSLKAGARANCGRLLTPWDPV